MTTQTALWFTLCNMHSAPSQSRPSLQDLLWHKYIAQVALVLLLVTELKSVQQKAIPGRAIACPSPQPGLLAHASQHKAAALGDVQRVHKPLRWQGPELTQPLGA